MLVKTYCAAVNGLEVTTVTIEVSMNPGVVYHLTGLGDKAVQEGRDRIAAALLYCGYKFPKADITVNMAPADLKKRAVALICRWQLPYLPPTEASKQLVLTNI